MVEFCCFGAMGLAVAALVLMSVTQQRRRQERLDRMAQALRAHPELGEAATRRDLQLGSFQRKRGNKRRRFWTMSVRVNLPGDVRIERAGALSLIASQLGKSFDVETGDPVFDQAFQLSASDEVDLVSRLGREARDALLRRVVGGGVSVEGGVVTRLADGEPASEAAVVAPAGEVLALAALLEGPEPTVEARLLARVLDARERERVRRRCRDALLERAPRSEEAQASLEVDLGAEEPDAGDGGLPLVVRTAAESVSRRLVAGEGRTRSLRFLATFEAANRVHPVIEEALLHALDDREPEHRRLAVQGLARSGAARAESALEAARDGASDPALAEAADVALRKVRARLRGGEAGQLSLAAVEDGQGQVSLAQPERDAEG